VASDYFDNSGSLSVNGGLTVKANTARLEGGQSTTWDVTLEADTVKMSSYRMTINGQLMLRVSQSLFDAGSEAGNYINVQNGFVLPIKPATGDLLGTTIQSEAPNFVSVSHIWAAEDRGAAVSGYQNNAALGSLVLGPVGIGTPEFFFQGAGAANALYVDFLDLGALGTNIEELLTVAPNLTIYFASVRLGFEPPTPPGGVPPTPEEYTDGLLGGRLQWVSGFAGPTARLPSS
jgi:hypothetical protein